VIVRHSKFGIQKRAPRKDGWSKTMRAKFLDHLAATCNVSASAARINRSPDSARDLRRRDGEFARLWGEAIAAGRERLEEELVACALGQMPTGDNPSNERQEPPAIRFDPELALQVLKLQSGGHQARRRAGPPPAQDDIDIALIERLEALAGTMAKDAVDEQPS
jgi:hypothetical protein